MTRLFTFKSSLAVAALLALPLAQAATISKASYNEGRTEIGAGYKADKAACAPMAGNAKDVCIEQAKAKRDVAEADLKVSYTGRTADQNRVLVVKAKSAYSVAKEKCDDATGNAKDVCVKEAKAVEVKALADAKMGKQIGEARTDAVDAKRDADYKVAAEKCDALAGDAKSSCVVAAKARFGKS